MDRSPNGGRGGSLQFSAMLYFDHNATAPLLPAARQAWLEAADTFIANPSSPHRLGGRADAAIMAARDRLARFLGCDALDISWTSGATESNNTVFHHFANTCPQPAEVWVSALEHPCVLEAARHWFPNRHRMIPVSPSGVTDLNWLEDALAHHRPGLVAIMAANNETGVLQPWREALALCQKHEIPFLCDATQWIGKLPANELGACDFVSGAAHKFGGPKGVGFLKCPSKGPVEPLLRGGPQEEGRRAGTQNVAGILSMLAALEVRQEQIARGEHDARALLRDEFCAWMLQTLPGSELAGKDQPRLWNTVSAFMPPASCEQRWIVKLDKLGCAVSTGSACSSGQEDPSHVLLAMGHSPQKISRALRFSSGWETGQQDWQSLGQALQTVYRQIHKMRPSALGVP